MPDPCLSSEDLLRLSVLMSGEVHAVRLDENAMVLHALTGRGEACVTLSPNCSGWQYARRVRQFLAGHVLGSPEGFPVYLQRWARMGQAREEGLDKLLLLGEPEAVVSVAYSPAVTDELARRAWWAMPVPDNARRMLEREAVVNGSMGSVLAEYLVEHLPFETEPYVILDTVRVVLRHGLVSEELRQRLWQRARHHATYYVGFMEMCPCNLPETARSLAVPELLGEEPAAGFWRQLAGGQGQAFLLAAEGALRQAPDQDVMNAALDALGTYFAPAAREKPDWWDDFPSLAGRWDAMQVLAGANRSLAARAMKGSSAVGALMRRKLAPVTEPLLGAIGLLRQQA